jgi:hypothetical protein
MRVTRTFVSGDEGRALKPANRVSLFAVACVSLLASVRAERRLDAHVVDAGGNAFDAASDAHDSAIDAPRSDTGPPVTGNAIVFFHGHSQWIPGVFACADHPSVNNLDVFFRRPVDRLADTMGVLHPQIDFPVGNMSCASHPWTVPATIDPSVWSRPNVVLAGFSSGREPLMTYFAQHRGHFPPTLRCAVMYDPCYAPADLVPGATAANEWMAGDASRTFLFARGACTGAMLAAQIDAAFAGSSGYHRIDTRATIHYDTVRQHFDLLWTHGCPALQNVAAMPGG